jgi:hypothetical protein
MDNIAYSFRYDQLTSQTTIQTQISALSISEGTSPKRGLNRRSNPYQKSIIRLLLVNMTHRDISYLKYKAQDRLL